MEILRDDALMGLGVCVYVCGARKSVERSLNVEDIGI